MMRGEPRTFGPADRFDHDCRPPDWAALAARRCPACEAAWTAIAAALAVMVALLVILPAIHAALTRMPG